MCTSNFSPPFKKITLATVTRLVLPALICANHTGHDTEQVKYTVTDMTVLSNLLRKSSRV
jgi:hypothetical protein